MHVRKLPANPRRSRRCSLRRGLPQLTAPGWTDEVRARLEQWVHEGSDRGLPVVFDFDNSIVCGDIGEATLAVLARDGCLVPARMSAEVSPPLALEDGALKPIAAFADATEYYESLLGLGAAVDADAAPMSTGYVWAAEAMHGLAVRQVADATARAFRMSQPGCVRPIEVRPGGRSYPAPFFYPEMVELIAVLLARRFDIWIVSASNVWSVRWMVLRALNPLLRARAGGRQIDAGKVVGVSTLLRDRSGRLHKDPVLLIAKPGYARLAGCLPGELTLTAKLHFPVPIYSGKVACIWERLGRAPYLGVGDSPGDHAMLAFCANRLWIARLEKPDYLRATISLRKRTGAERWVLQPTLVKQAPGFVPARDVLEQRLGAPSESIESSWRMLARTSACRRAGFMGGARSE